MFFSEDHTKNRNFYQFSNLEARRNFSASKSKMFACLSHVSDIGTFAHLSACFPFSRGADISEFLNMSYKLLCGIGTVLVVIVA